MFVRTLALVALWIAPAHAESGQHLFKDQPFRCGSAVGFKECRASFDGWQLSIDHRTQEGRSIVTLYRKCTTTKDMILCAEGEWRSGNETGKLPGRSIGVRDGKPFPE